MAASTATAAAWMAKDVTSQRRSDTSQKVTTACPASSDEVIFVSVAWYNVEKTAVRQHETSAR